MWLLLLQKLEIIRNEAELTKIREYTMDNPAKWALDEENPKNQGKWSVMGQLHSVSLTLMPIMRNEVKFTGSTSLRYDEHISRSFYED